MPRIWLLDPAAVIFSGIFLFFIFFLGWQVLGKILRPWFFPTPEEAASPAIKNTSAPKLFFCLLVLFSPFLAGILWAWFRPALMVIDQTGNLDFRNPFFISRVHVPASVPRTLEALIEADPWSQESPSFRGNLWITVPGGATACVYFPFFPKDLDDKPFFFQELGFRGIQDWPKGPNGGIITPLHSYSSAGPLFLPAEKGPE